MLLLYTTAVNVQQNQVGYSFFHILTTFFSKTGFSLIIFLIFKGIFTNLIFWTKRFKTDILIPILIYLDEIFFRLTFVIWFPQKKSEWVWKLWEKKSAIFFFNISENLCKINYQKRDAYFYSQNVFLRIREHLRIPINVHKNKKAPEGPYQRA